MLALVLRTGLSRYADRVRRRRFRGWRHSGGQAADRRIPRTGPGAGGRWRRAWLQSEGRQSDQHGAPTQSTTSSRFPTATSWSSAIASPSSWRRSPKRPPARSPASTRRRPLPGLASKLGALFINDWFLASAMVDAEMREVDLLLRSAERGAARCDRRHRRLSPARLPARRRFHDGQSHRRGGLQGAAVACGAEHRRRREFPLLVLARAALGAHGQGGQAGRAFPLGRDGAAALAGGAAVALSGSRRLGRAGRARDAAHGAPPRAACALPLRLIPLAPGCCRCANACVSPSGWRAISASNIRWRHRRFAIGSGGELIPQPIPAASAASGVGL